MQIRSIKTIVILVVTLLMITGIEAVAQRGWGMGRMGGMQLVCPSIPNLTEEQRSQIMDLRTNHLIGMQSYLDQIDANRVQYRALMRSGMTDMSAINANIDERNSIRNQMDTKLAEHHQALKSILTEDQRVWFDNAWGGSRDGMQPGMPFGGRGAGMRAGPGRGGMWQAAPYGGRGAGMWGAAPYGARGAYCPWVGRGFRRGFRGGF